MGHCGVGLQPLTAVRFVGTSKAQYAPPTALHTHMDVSFRWINALTVVSTIW